MVKLQANIIRGSILLYFSFLVWILSNGLFNVDSNGILRFTGWLFWCISPFLPLFIISFKRIQAIRQLSWLSVGVFVLSVSAVFEYIQALYITPDIESGFAFIIIPAMQWVGSIFVSALVIVYGAKNVSL